MRERGALLTRPTRRSVCQSINQSARRAWVSFTIIAPHIIAPSTDSELHHRYEMRGEIDTATHNSSDDLRVEDVAAEPADPAMEETTAAIDAAVTTPLVMTQGNFVTSFELTRTELETAVDVAKSQLPQLMAECDPTEQDGWRRIRGKKGSCVKLWEKGCASVLTHTGNDRKWKQPKTSTRQRKSLPVPEDFHQRATISATAISGGEGAGNMDAYAVRSSITVHASLSSVMKALDCSTATAYRSCTKIIYENLVSDTSVLSHKYTQSTSVPSSSSSAPPTQLAESLAVRWIACNCSVPLVSDCDLCLIEYSKVHTIDELLALGTAPNNNYYDENYNCSDRGSSALGLRASDKMPIAYKILKSMETKHCPELSDAPHHLVRVHVPLGGFLLYTTDHEDVTDVMFFMSARFNRKNKRTKKSPSTAAPFLSSDDRQIRAIQHVMQQMALAIDRLHNAVDAYTMSLQLETLRATKWIENSDRSECVVCYRRFHPITRRRHHCRMCGDVICRDCSIHKDADLPTIGPTTLRICKLCNVEHFGRSSLMASIANDLKQAQRREPAGEPTDPDSASVSKRRQTTTLMIDTSTSRKQSSPKKTHVDNQRLHRTRRHSIDPRLSCPKPSVPVSQRQTTGNERVPTLSPTKFTSPGKWSRAFYANRAAASPAPPRHRVPSPQPTFAQTLPLPRSVTKDSRPQYPGTPHRFNFGLMKRSVLSPQPRPRQHSMSDNLESPQGHFKTAPLGFAATMPVKSSSSLASPKPKPTRSNQTHDTLNDTRTLSLTRQMTLDPVTEYEDLLRELCQRASDATAARYAAVSIFIPQGKAPGSSSPSSPSMVHYLKATSSPKLMRIAANMLCCEPVLRALRPVATRNALSFNVSGVDFASLPFVKGPQRARFYCGVPLVNSKRRVLGALAVFDARMDDEDEDVLETMGPLQSITRATMERIETRVAKNQLDAFMKNPLLQSVEQQLVSRADEDDDYGDDEDDDRSVEWVDEDHMRAMPRAAPTLDFYKRQMHRLVQQANQTQGQLLQNGNAMHMHHGVSY